MINLEFVISNTASYILGICYNTADDLLGIRYIYITASYMLSICYNTADELLRLRINNADELLGIRYV